MTQWNDSGTCSYGSRMAHDKMSHNYRMTHDTAVEKIMTTGTMELQFDCGPAGQIKPYSTAHHLGGRDTFSKRAQKSWQFFRRQYCDCSYKVGRKTKHGLYQVDSTVGDRFNNKAVLLQWIFIGLQTTMFYSLLTLACTNLSVPIEESKSWPGCYSATLPCSGQSNQKFFRHVFI